MPAFLVKNRNYLLAFAVNCSVYFSFYLFLSTLPLYILEAINGKESEIGVTVGVFSIAAMLFHPVSGYILDAKGRKKPMIVSAFCFAVLSLFYYSAKTIFLLILLRGVHGIFFSMLKTGAQTLVSDIVPKEKIGRGISIFGMSTTVSMAISPVVGFYLYERFGYTSLFKLQFLIASIAFLMLLLFDWKVCPAPAPDKKLSFDNLIEKKVIDIAVFLFLCGTCYSAVGAFVTVFGKTLGYSNPAAFFTCQAVTVLVCRFVMGAAFDKIGPALITLPAFGMMSVAFFILSLGKTYPSFLFSAVFMGAGYGTVYSGLLAVTSKKVDASRRGVANGTAFMGFDLGTGIGPIILGHFVVAYSIVDTFKPCAALSFCTMVCFFVFVIRRQH